MIIFQTNNYISHNPYNSKMGLYFLFSLWLGKQKEFKLTHLFPVSTFQTKRSSLSADGGATSLSNVSK